MRTTLVTATVILGMLHTAQSSAQPNWPQFRGDSAGVVVDDPSLPDTWGPQENVLWSIDVPGRSWSSPIVWDDHVFILSVVNIENTESPLRPIEDYRARSLGGAMTAAAIVATTGPLRWIIYDVDLQTGKIRWERILHEAIPSEPTHQKSSFAAETPVTDGEHLYVYLGDIGLYAIDFDGGLRWSIPMEWLPRRNWGAAASPVIHDGRLYLVNDNENQSYVAAYNLSLIHISEPTRPY